MRPIDADRLLTDRMKSKYYHLPNGDIAIPLVDIEHAPTIDPVRKGKWIDGRCSQCGGEAYWKRGRDVYGWREFAIELTKYCPNCGSLNEEEGEQNG